MWLQFARAIAIYVQSQSLPEGSERTHDRSERTELLLSLAMVNMLNLDFTEDEDGGS